MPDELAVFNTFGQPVSAEHQAILRAAFTDMIARFNEVPTEIKPDVIASVMLTVFLSQSDPAWAYNHITACVANAMQMVLTDTAGNA